MPRNSTSGLFLRTYYLLYGVPLFTYTFPPSPLFLFPSLNIYWQKRGKERERERESGGLGLSLFSLPRLDLAAAAAAAAAGEEEDD